MAIFQLKSARFSASVKYFIVFEALGYNAQMLVSMLSNSYGGFENDQNQYITAAMKNSYSLFQHSCTPNSMKFSVGNQTVLAMEIAFANKLKALED